MEEACSRLIIGLDRLLTEHGNGRDMLRLVASQRAVGGRIRGCETIMLGNAVNGSEDSFSELIRRVCNDSARGFDAVDLGGTIRILQLEGFSEIRSLPENLHRLFSNVINIHIVDCPKFSSLSTTVSLRQLTHLYCTKCASLASLASLSALPVDSQMHSLSFNECGLSVTRDDDWASGMEALARTGRNRAGFLSISISGCDSLTHLPSSIGKLKDTVKNRVLLYLRRNANLSHLPHELGNIPKLLTLGIESCPKIVHLPWTLKRLSLHTSIDLSNQWGLIENMGMTKAAKAFGPPFFTIDRSISYFTIARRKFYHGLFLLSIYFARARRRAIERLYAPGGTRYEEGRDRFEETIRVW